VRASSTATRIAGNSERSETCPKAKLAKMTAKAEKVAA
jgi:hypothetical protein